MEFFTPEWASGNLDDDDSAAVVQRYNEYLGSLDKAGAVWRFATTVNLNDAYLDRVIVDKLTGNLKLSLLTGDLQVGYWMTELTYSAAQIVDGAEILRLALSKRPSEIWYDEFSGSPHAGSHAFLIAPRQDEGLQSWGEFRITFDGFHFTQKRVISRQLPTSEDQSDWG